MRKAVFLSKNKTLETINILGVPVGAVDMPLVLDTLRDWIRDGTSRYICATDVFNVTSASANDQHRAALLEADLIVPDGTPLSWVGRLRGNRRIRRVCGPDLLLAACERSQSEGWRHFFYGGAEGVAESLAETLKERYPGLQVAGTECPPFRPLSEEETAQMVDRVEAANTDIMWIGLGCPKQEIWMNQHVGRMKDVVLVGVGAAFDFHTDRVHRAPAWMRNYGLEWLHRLTSEPKRLWRRYCYYAPRFVLLSLIETLFPAKFANN